MSLAKCKECGNTISKSAKNCPQCGAKTKRTSPIAWVVLIIIIVFFGFPLFNGYISTAKERDSNSSVVEFTQSKEDFIAECKEYSYEEIARNPNNYIDNSAKFVGEVVQTVYDKNNIVLRVNVTNVNGYWENTIYVDYKITDPNAPRILEKDIIVLYGTLNGIKDYETVLGDQESIPHLKAKYIEIQ